MSSHKVSGMSYSGEYGIGWLLLHVLKELAVIIRDLVLVHATISSKDRLFVHQDLLRSFAENPRH